MHANSDTRSDAPFADAAFGSDWRGRKQRFCWSGGRGPLVRDATRHKGLRVVGLLCVVAWGCLSSAGGGVLGAPLAGGRFEVADTAVHDGELAGIVDDVSFATISTVSQRGEIAGRFIGPANPRWEFTADALLLWQGNITNRVYYTNPVGNSVLEAAQGQTPLSVGPRFGLLLNLDQERALEVNYFQASPFRGEQTTPPSDGEYTMSDLAGFDLSGVSGATFETDALIQSFEANWRRGNGGPLTWLVGFRWVEWDESLSIRDTAGQFTDAFDTLTGNDLYGAQLGLDAMLWNRSQVISIDGVAKAGVYYNNAYQQTSAYDGVSRGPLRASANETSFFGELGITMDARITEWLSWRLGYTAFWLSGVAEAAGQLSSTELQLPVPPPATINTNGSVFLQGFTTGIEARW